MKFSSTCLLVLLLASSCKGRDFDTAYAVSEGVISGGGDGIPMEIDCRSKSNANHVIQFYRPTILSGAPAQFINWNLKDTSAVWFDDMNVRQEIDASSGSPTIVYSNVDTKRGFKLVIPLNASETDSALLPQWSKLTTDERNPIGYLRMGKISDTTHSVKNLEVVCWLYPYATWKFDAPQ